MVGVCQNTGKQGQPFFLSSESYSFLTLIHVAMSLRARILRPEVTAGYSQTFSSYEAFYLESGELNWLYLLRKEDRKDSIPPAFSA